MKNRKAVHIQTTWTSGTRDKASGKEALWDRFLGYGYDCHSLTTRVTFGTREWHFGRPSEKKGWMEGKRGRERRGKQSGHSMSQRDCRLTGTPVLSNVAFVAERAFLAATTFLSLIVSSLVTSSDSSTWPLLCVSLRRRVKTKQIHSIRFLWLFFFFFHFEDGKVKIERKREEKYFSRQALIIF